MKFKVGDRVKYVSDNDKYNGLTGTVAEIVNGKDNKYHVIYNCEKTKDTFGLSDGVVFTDWESDKSIRLVTKLEKALT